MNIRWGQISLLALLAGIAVSVGWNIGRANSQETDDPQGDSGAATSPGDDAVASVRAELADAIDIRCEVRGTSTILEIVADGTEVKAGDLLVRLDDSSLRDDADTELVAVFRWQVRLQQAQAQLETLTVSADADRQTLALRREIAELELRQYLEAALLLEITESESRIKLLERQVSVLTEQVETLQRFVSEQAAAPGDLESARLELFEAEANLELARLSHRNLTEYEGPLQTKKLELEVVETRSALEQVDRARTASRVQAEADVFAATVAVENAEQKSAEIRDAIDKCTIYAPCDGVVHLVVLNYNGRPDGRPTNVPVPGVVVREGSVLMRIFESEE